ncbi:PREDICTED: zinc finger BED domain-containing protein RICESLEEPER 2-like [Ipomoea nil]|uniref:zinc finger BED domain-containing protein RICESLEEPER 2-like n=1 Tax=Ipomoea nil TaxID=35883 RepID=UPI000901FD41|nr:PREDICTED: zinc finger BED domain-containing protein RICESLEEPER 2-like [Ipomoea nil]
MESATQMTQSGLPPSTEEGPGGVTLGTETNAPQQPEVNPAVPAKKRKNVESRSKVWEHFEKIYDSENKVIKGKCIYCAKFYQSESKKHDTTSLRNHMYACLKNPHSKETRNSLLTFTAVTTFDTQGGSEGVVGELGTWVFNQEAIRRALCGQFQGTFTKFTYLDERLNLKKLFRLNTQRWKLNKKIISFVPISSHMGEHIAKALESCLIDWGIRDVFSVTVDNASSNDTAMGWVRFADSSVKKVRDSVRWMRNSPARLKKFRDLAELLGVEAKSSLQLDVPTRWNSTYMMLSTVIQYKVVFDAYSLNEPSFAADMGDSVPSFLDWTSVECLVVLLKGFYEMTIRNSGSLYVTSNNFFSEISNLSCMLSSMIVAGSATEVMGSQMKTKFEKYWGDPEKMNSLIFFANILDPRDKLEYMSYQFEELYGKDNGKKYLENVQAAMVELFGDYAATYSVNVQQSSSDSSSGSQPDVPPIQSHTTIGRPQNMLKNKLKRQKMEASGSYKETELQVYLSEKIVEDTPDFDILRWWKLNSERFPTLSKMARDILAVPISTVASESTFSTSGRVLDAFRSSLTPKIVEALVCAQDWMRLPNQPVKVEENIDDVEKLEQDLATGVSRFGTTRFGAAGFPLPTISYQPTAYMNVISSGNNSHSTLVPYSQVLTAQKIMKAELLSAEG